MGQFYNSVQNEKLHKKKELHLVYYRRIVGYNELYTHKNENRKKNANYTSKIINFCENWNSHRKIKKHIFIK